MWVLKATNCRSWPYFFNWLNVSDVTGEGTFLVLSMSCLFLPLLHSPPTPSSLFLFFFISVSLLVSCVFLSPVSVPLSLTVSRSASLSLSPVSPSQCFHTQHISFSVCFVFMCVWERACDVCMFVCMCLCLCMFVCVWSCVDMACVSCLCMHSVCSCVCACVFVCVCLCICVVCIMCAVCVHACVWFVSVPWHLLFFFTLSVPFNCPWSSDLESYFPLCLFPPLTLLLLCHFTLYFSLMLLSFLCSMTKRGKESRKDRSRGGDKLHSSFPYPRSQSWPRAHMPGSAHTP